MQPTTFEVKPEDLERGLKNEHYSKFEREQLMNKHDVLLLEDHQIQRQAGFYKKKNNIFIVVEEKNDNKNI